MIVAARLVRHVRLGQPLDLGLLISDVALQFVYLHLPLQKLVVGGSQQLMVQTFNFFFLLKNFDLTTLHLVAESAVLSAKHNQLFGWRCDLLPSLQRAFNALLSLNFFDLILQHGNESIVILRFVNHNLDFLLEH